MQFVLDLLYNKLYNKSTANWSVYNKSTFHNKSTTNRISGSLDFDKLWTYCGVAANHSELLYYVMTTSLLYVIEWRLS